VRLDAVPKLLPTGTTTAVALLLATNKASSSSSGGSSPKTSIPLPPCRRPVLRLVAYLYRPTLFDAAEMRGAPRAQ
jgi:hypothetical protein